MEPGHWCPKVHGMRPRNQDYHLSFGQYQSIECTSHDDEHPLTLSTNPAAETVRESGGFRERVATEENSFNTINKCDPENLRRSEADTDVGVRIC